MTLKKQRIIMMKKLHHAGVPFVQAAKIAKLYFTGCLFDQTPMAELIWGFQEAGTKGFDFEPQTEEGFTVWMPTFKGQPLVEIAFA